MVKLPYISWEKTPSGKLRARYQRGGRKTTIKGEIASPEWYASYREIDAGYGKPSKAEPPELPAKGSFAAAIVSYLQSPRYRVLADKTKSNYRLELERLPAKMRELPARKVTRLICVAYVEKVASKSPRRAIEVAKVLWLVMRHAANRGLIDAHANPLAAKLDKPAGYRAAPHRPWSEQEIATFLEGAAPVWRRALIVLLATGLRRADALELTRDHIRDGRIYITPGKTADASGEVVIPVLRRLAAELAISSVVEPITRHLICGPRGTRIRGDVLSHAIAKEARRLGIHDPPPLHGLRKNAVMWLLEEGCSEEQINGITGQSKEMIRHYGRRFRREKLAEQVRQKVDGEP